MSRDSGVGDNGGDDSPSRSGRRSSGHPQTPSTHDGNAMRDFINSASSQHHVHDRSKSQNVLSVTERLNNEKIRANTAEQRLKEMMPTLRTVIDARNTALQDYARTHEELRLWKVQLENARAELRKGQDIIAKLEEERDEALAAAARDRAKVRKLLLEKAVWKARDEGWTLGYKEGLQAAQKGPSTDTDVRRRLHMKHMDVVDDPFEDGKQSRAHTAGTPQRNGPSPPQRQSSRAHDRSRGPTSEINNPLRSSSGARPSSSSVTQPAPLSLIQSVEQIHRSMTRTSPLQDGFIPTADSHSFISIPPPHDLSNPVPSPGASPILGPVGRRDYGRSTSADAPPSAAPAVRSPSALSRGSTHISQYALVSPASPEQIVTPLSVSRNRASNTTKEQSPSQKIAQQWRRSSSPDRGPVIPSEGNRDSSQRVNSRFELGGQPSHGAIGGQSPYSPRSPLEEHHRANTLSRMNSSDIEIQVVAPSQSPSNASIPTLATQPHLLSPNHAEEPLPTSSESWQPPPPMITFPPADGTPIVLADDQLPPGFVPMSMTPLPKNGQALPQQPHRQSLYAAGTGMSENPSTAQRPNGKSTPSARRMSIGGGMSPAPLDRLSLFSEDKD